MSYKVVCFGEILWDNLREGRRLGGAPLNVCYHLTKMGISSIFISKVGNDSNGAAIRQELQKLGIDGHFCLTSTSMPTSTVEVRLTGKQKVTYDIVENVAWDAIDLTGDIEELVRASEGFVYGSLVARSAVSRTTLLRLLQVAKYRVFDLNLRAPFYNKDLILELMSHSHLLKLNEDELVILCDWMQIDKKEVLDQLSDLLTRFENIEEILFTRGECGSVYYSRQMYEIVDAVKVKVQDTIGSGDSFLAAFLAYKFQGKQIDDALRQAALLSGFVATQRGACPEYDPRELASFNNMLFME